MSRDKEHGFRRHRLLIGLALVVLLAAPVLLWQTTHWARFLALTAIKDGSRNTLSLVVENL